MKKLGVILIVLTMMMQLVGCMGNDPATGEKDAPTSTVSSFNNRIDDEDDNRFSYLDQLSAEKQIAFAEFKAERDLQYLYEFTPEDMVIVYLYCLSVGDPDLIYAITYNGGKLPDQDTFREEYFEYASSHDSETAVHYRYYDSIKVDESTAKENELTVIVTTGVGLMTHSLALGLQKEDNVWRLDIYHLIDHYKKQQNADEVVYFGKGEVWLATFSVFKVNNSLFDSLYIQYIGENRAEKVGPIEYSFVGDGFKFESQYPQELQGVRSFQTSSEANADMFSYKPNEDGVFTLTIKYSGKTETLSLSSMTK